MGAWKHRLSNVNAVDKTATCECCGPVSIYTSKKARQCKVARNQRRRLCNAKLGRIRKPSKYGKDWYRYKRATLGACCEVCGSTKQLRRDHDHETFEFRGTLCNNCNVAIGLFHENTDSLEKAIEYLKNRKAPNTRTSQ